MTRTDKALLRVDAASVHYGPIAALKDCSLHVEDGEAVAVVGANGAGKTTLLRAICGLLPLKGGRIRFQGDKIDRVSTFELARTGMLHIPDTRGILRGLTVVENLQVGYESSRPTRPFDEALAEVFETFPRLSERRHQPAGSMSGGEQQMLALSRAIMSPPRILLLDEPSLGLSPLMVREAFRVLRRFRDRGMAMLLVEQNVRSALKFSSRAYVLRQGRIVQQGAAAVLAEDENLFKNYLGVQ